MIEGKNIGKRYGAHPVLRDVQLSWPRTGMIGIYGPSGSGKSTLLAILAGLTSFTGQLKIWNLDVGDFDLDASLEYRRTTVGLLFQHYHLFANETVAWNVALPLRLAGLWDSHGPHIVQKRLDLIGLGRHASTQVRYLSGGEQQRVALARALIRQPRLLLADEPTAALDEENKKAIFEILVRASQKSLVVVVSHDEELLAAYCQDIYEMNDGRLWHRQAHKFAKETVPLTHVRLPIKEKTGGLPWMFCFRHAIDGFKKHKWRHLIGQGMLSVALAGIGLGILVTEATETKMLGAFTAHMGRQGVQISQETAPYGYLDGVYSPEEETLTAIAARYPEQTLGVSPGYSDDIDAFFPTRHIFYLAKEGPMLALPNYRMSDVAKFRLPFEVGMEGFQLPNDELILGVINDDLPSLAYYLRVSPDSVSVNRFLEINQVTLVVSVANEAWRYDDEQLWHVAAIVVTNAPMLIHSNMRWNEWVLETSMRFPATTKHETTGSYPWLLHKRWSLVTEDERVLMEMLTGDYELGPLRFDYGRPSDLTVCPSVGHCPSHRIEAALDPLQTLNLATIAAIVKSEPALREPIIGTEGGYLAYPEAMFSGFVNQTFFTANLGLVEELIDWFSYEEASGVIADFPPGVAYGHYEDQGEQSVRLKTWPRQHTKGSSPQGLDELALSAGLAQTVFGTSQALGRQMYVLTRLARVRSETGFYSDFHISMVTITGVSEEQTPAIYGTAGWSVRYYRDVVGLPSTSLRPLLAYFEFDEGETASLANAINRRFPYVTCRFPQQALRQSLGAIIKDINRGMIVLGLVAGSNAVILALLVLVISWDEMQKERRLLFELGAASNQIARLLVARLTMLLGAGVAVATIELLVVSVFIEHALANYFEVAFSYRLPLMPWLAMAACAIILYGLLRLLSRQTVIDKSYRRQK